MIVAFTSSYVRAVQAVALKPHTTSNHAKLAGTFLDVKDPFNPLLVATDGKLLVTAPMHSMMDEGQVPVDYIIPLLQVKKGRDRLLILNTEKHTLTDGNDVLSFAPVQSRLSYPDWRKGCPNRGDSKNTGVPKIGIDPRPLAKVANELTNFSTLVFKFGATSEEVIEIWWNDDVHGCVMPYLL